MKNLRTYFTFSGLAASLVLGLLPSLWDSVSDFKFAEEEEKSENLGINPHTGLSTSTYFSYWIISLPLYVTAATGLHRLFWMFIAKCCNRCSQYRVCRGAEN